MARVVAQDRLEQFDRAARMFLRARTGTRRGEQRKRVESRRFDIVRKRRV
jgi:hypothetical protein